MEKLKVLWFGLVPLGWFLALKLVIWVQFYPIVCDASKESPIGLCMFLAMTGILGTILLFGASIGLAIYLQE